MIKLFKRRGVLYTDLTLAKCKERFNADINAYCGKNFSGGSYNDYFYVKKSVRGRWRDTQITFNGDFKEYDEGTQIIYIIENPYYIIAAVVPLIMLVIGIAGTFLYPDLEFTDTMLVIPLVFSYALFTLTFLVTAVYHEYALVKFVKSVFNI